jgi:enamine deaminase RidA (YjgF/YER057c/UK114 family)
MTSPEERLRALGIDLPAAAAPVAAYVPCVRSGDLVYVSGQVPLVDGKPAWTGRLGAGGLGVEEGAAAAQRCAVNVIAALKAELGDLGRVRRVVKVTGFVACEPDFTDHPRVVNGASELFGEVFGEAGRHARAAVGVAALPLGVPVEVEAIVEVTG